MDASARAAQLLDPVATVPPSGPSIPRAGRFITPASAATPVTEPHYELGDDTRQWQFTAKTISPRGRPPVSSTQSDEM